MVHLCRPPGKGHRPVCSYQPEQAVIPAAKGHCCGGRDSCLRRHWGVRLPFACYMDSVHGISPPPVLPWGRFSSSVAEDLRRRRLRSGRQVGWERTAPGPHSAAMKLRLAEFLSMFSFQKGNKNVLLPKVPSVTSVILITFLWHCQKPWTRKFT